jgi:Skp family chaperone for outer membrane proteins
MRQPKFPQTFQVIEKIIATSRWWKNSTRRKLTTEEKKELSQRLKAARKNILTDISNIMSDIKQMEKELEMERLILDKLKGITNTDIEYAEEHILNKYYRKVR